MRLTSALAERSGTERDDGFVLKGVAALTTVSSAPHCIGGSCCADPI
jgi:hypothetical protein